MRKSGPPKGLIAYLVLELLEEKPRYGYEILKEIREISGGHWEPSYGSVYPILYKFEEKGWGERIEREGRTRSEVLRTHCRRSRRTRRAPREWLGEGP